MSTHSISERLQQTERPSTFIFEAGMYARVELVVYINVSFCKPSGSQDCCCRRCCRTHGEMTQTACQIHESEEGAVVPLIVRFFYYCSCLLSTAAVAAAAATLLLLPSVYIPHVREKRCAWTVPQDISTCQRTHLQATSRFFFREGWDARTARHSARSCKRKSLGSSPQRASPKPWRPTGFSRAMPSKTGCTAVSTGCTCRTVPWTCICSTRNLPLVVTCSFAAGRF